MNTEFITGINEEKINSLAVEILNCSDRVSDIFDKIDNKNLELDNYLKGDVRDEFKIIYENIRNNYHSVKSSICSYSTDLNNLVVKLKINDKVTYEKFIDEASCNKSMANEIEML